MFKKYFAFSFPSSYQGDWQLWFWSEFIPPIFASHHFAKHKQSVKIKNNISTFPFSSNNTFDKFFLIKITNSRPTLHVKKSILPTYIFVMYYSMLPKSKSIESFPFLVYKISLTGSLTHGFIYSLVKFMFFFCFIKVVLTVFHSNYLTRDCLSKNLRYCLCNQNFKDCTCL